MAIPENEQWHEVFSEYQSLECLWKSTSNDFKNKNMRNAAWATLLQKFKYIDKHATVDKVKQKIHNIRSVYRRELKKVRDSEKSGAGTDDIYIPSLWYFDCLEFLRDFETPVPGLSTMEKEEDDVEILESSTSKDCKRHRLNNNSSSKSSEDRSSFLQKAVSHLEKVEQHRSLKDEASTYSESWAFAFRTMPSDQQIYAKQAIDKILIRSRLGKLWLNYLPKLLCNEDAAYTRTSSPIMVSPTSFSQEWI